MYQDAMDFLLRIYVCRLGSMKPNFSLLRVLIYVE